MNSHEPNYVREVLWVVLGILALPIVCTVAILVNGFV